MNHVRVIEALADAIQHYEGWNATSRSYRNRNPGNLRASHPTERVDKDGYRVFLYLEDGYAALWSDLWHKITGKNSHGLNAGSSLLQLFSVYAPAGDRNAPVAYAAFAATWLRQVYNNAPVYGTTTIAEIFKLAGEEVPGGEHNTGDPVVPAGSVTEIPFDRVDRGAGVAVESGPSDPATVGDQPGSGPESVRLPDDRPEASAEAV